MDLPPGLIPVLAAALLVLLLSVFVGIVDPGLLAVLLILLVLVFACGKWGGCGPDNKGED